MKTNTLITSTSPRVIFLLLLLLFIFPLLLKAQQQNQDLKLLDDYIASNSYKDVIVFDSSNIKRFWVDKTVSGKDGFINILLNPSKNGTMESVPLKIQLANVSVIQKCKVDVYSVDSGFSFNILDKDSNVISRSNKEDDFIEYHLSSASFQLSQTDNYSFSLSFVLENNDDRFVRINRIVLSFSLSDRFKVQPEVLAFTKDNVAVSPNIGDIQSDTSFSISGKRSRVFSQKIIDVTQNGFTNSVKIKNTGDNPTRIYIGYLLISKDGNNLGAKNFPYQDNKCLSVVSAEIGKKTIIVDGVPKWKKNSCLAINARTDFSDIPSTSFAGKIIDLTELPDGHSKITLDQTISTQINPGDLVRVHNPDGGYLYTTTTIMQPGEEMVFNSFISLDETCYDYSAKALPKGTYSVKPVILSYSIDADLENTVLISDYCLYY